MHMDAFNRLHANVSPLSLDIFFSSSWTNRLISSTDRASVQIEIGKVDEATGIYNKDVTTFALSGYVRAKVFLRHKCL